MSLDALLPHTMHDLLRELVSGPPGDFAFMVNPGDPGLLGSLSRLSAADASSRPDDRSSVAAHVHHVRYGLGLLNRWAAGEDPFTDADFAASWQQQTVTDAGWRELRVGLEREASQWMAAVAQPRDWDAVTLSNALGSIAHLAYHLGAIRQVAAAAAGPRARD